MVKRVNLHNRPLVQNLEEADATMARIAELNRHMTLIKTGLNEDIARLQLAANDQLSPLQAEKELLERSLCLFLEERKDELFTDKKRSRELSFGTVGVSALPGEVTTINNTPWKRVLELLQEKKLAQYIRNTPEVDKDALKGADPVLLKEVRCRIKSGEKVYYRLVDHANEQGAA